MTQSTPPPPGQISGISLASFLQILEQERKTCNLVVQSADNSGTLFFHEGVLVDAECGPLQGEEAFYELLVWQTPAFTVTDPVEERQQQITKPLAHLLLNAATRQDESREQPQQDEQKRPAEAPANKNQGVEHLVETILATPGIRGYFLLNRHGKVISQSTENKQIGPFITFSVITGIQMRKALQARGPQRIQLLLEGGEMLLIIPGGGMIIGLLLTKDAVMAEITAQLRPVLIRS